MSSTRIQYTPRYKLSLDAIEVKPLFLIKSYPQSIPALPSCPPACKVECTCTFYVRTCACCSIHVDVLYIRETSRCLRPPNDWKPPIPTQDTTEYQSEHTRMRQGRSVLQSACARHNITLTLPCSQISKTDVRIMQQTSARWRHAPGNPDAPQRNCAPRSTLTRPLKSAHRRLHRQ